MILLDTNVLIDFDSYTFDPSQSYCASMLSRAELTLGVVRAQTAQDGLARRAKLALLDAWIDWLPFDQAASEGYGIVAGAAKLTGARLRNKDALIAGQAYSLGLSIMTANVDDFVPFSAHVVAMAPTPNLPPLS